jgi:hypothetical protein
MHACSIHRGVEVVPGQLADYDELARYHYRDARPAAVKAVFTLRHKQRWSTLTPDPVGVIVYAMPNPRVELRDVATSGRFKGLDRQTQLALINRNIRCIARVVIEPRYRGVGLAARLVRETLPQMEVPIVEALGIMPLLNPFLERAGMQPYAPRPARHHTELLEALSTVGVEDRDLIDPPGVQEKLDALTWPAADFIEIRIQQFLKSHGRRRTMPPGLDRTRYLLGKLTHRPAYYIWFHPDLEVTTP